MAKKLKTLRKKKVAVGIPKLPKALNPKVLNTHLDEVAKARARNDARVARNAQDSMLRQFATAHLAAQTKANPHLTSTYFPSFRELPIPR